MLTEKELRESHERYQRELHEAGITDELIREGRRKLIRHTAGYWLKRFFVVSFQGAVFYVGSILALVVIEKIFVQNELPSFPDCVIFLCFLVGLLARQ